MRRNEGFLIPREIIRVADDVNGDPVFLAKNEFYLGYTRERDDTAYGSLPS